MFLDEEPTQKPTVKNLEPMSVSELEEYIQEMHEEIERVKGEISRKKASNEAAASLFKS